jgi:hypothetical protein
MAATSRRRRLLRAALLTACAGVACAARSASAGAGTLLLRGASSSDSDTTTSSSASADATEVLRVPGFDGPLPSRHYAGYVTVDEAHGRQACARAFVCSRRVFAGATRVSLTPLRARPLALLAAQLFYYLATSERSEKDPLVLWLNGV